MSTRYLWILGTARPFQFDVDENDRHKWSANFVAQAAAPVDDWLGEIGKLINDASLGTFGTDMIRGVKATWPTGDGPYVRLVDTGGAENTEGHGGEKYENLSCQVQILARDYDDARTRALAIWRTLDGVRDTTVTA